MPRAWGYLAVALAVAIGCAALLMPLPETIEIAPPVQVASRQPPKPRPQAQPNRPRMKAPRQAAKAKPPAPVFPRQDTTKSRTLVRPQGQSAK